MTRLVLLGALALTGCAQQPAAEVPQAAIAVPSMAPEAAGSPPTANDSTSDLGGQTVARAVAPDTPALPPIGRFDPVPRSRMLPVVEFIPEHTARPSHHLAPVLAAQSIGMRLAPPVERVPPDLGRGAGAVPAKPKLPVAKVVTARARDVNLPPPLPVLGRPAVERVPLDDPTSELANAAIVEPVVKVPFVPAAFLKVVIPDPFELADQVKPQVAPSAEPGLTPVPVNPRRVK